MAQIIITEPQKIDTSGTPSFAGHFAPPQNLHSSQQPTFQALPLSPPMSFRALKPEELVVIPAPEVKTRLCEWIIPDLADIVCGYATISYAHQVLDRVKALLRRNFDEQNRVREEKEAVDDPDDIKKAEDEVNFNASCKIMAALTYGFFQPTPQLVTVPHTTREGLIYMWIAACVAEVPWFTSKVALADHTLVDSAACVIKGFLSWTQIASQVQQSFGDIIVNGQSRIAIVGRYTMGGISLQPRCDINLLPGAKPEPHVPSIRIAAPPLNLPDLNYTTYMRTVPPGVWPVWSYEREMQHLPEGLAAPINIAHLNLLLEQRRIDGAQVQTGGTFTAVNNTGRTIHAGERVWVLPRGPYTPVEPPAYIEEGLEFDDPPLEPVTPEEEVKQQSPV